MLALEGMKNAQAKRSMYLRVGERLAEIRKSRKISQAKLAKLLGVVEGTIQNYEHGRNEPNITRLYDASGAGSPVWNTFAGTVNNRQRACRSCQSASRRRYAMSSFVICRLVAANMLFVQVSRSSGHFLCAPGDLGRSGGVVKAVRQSEPRPNGGLGSARYPGG